METPHKVRLTSASLFRACAELKDAGGGDAGPPKLRLHAWSTPASRGPRRQHTAAGTTASLSADDDETLESAENQLMYVILGTVLGVVVLIVVVCIAMCTWRHQRQPRRAVGTSTRLLT